MSPFVIVISLWSFLIEVIEELARTCPLVEGGVCGWNVGNEYEVLASLQVVVEVGLISFLCFFNDSIHNPSDAQRNNEIQGDNI